MREWMQLLGIWRFEACCVKSTSILIMILAIFPVGSHAADGGYSAKGSVLQMRVRKEGVGGGDLLAQRDRPRACHIT